MRIKIRGKFWNLRFPRLDTKIHRGYCDPPNKINKEIVVASQLEGLEKLDIVLHELLHAAGWDVFDESFVAQTAADLARVLWRLGYRNEHENE